MFDGIDLSKINLNEIMSQAQAMAEKAKVDNEGKIFTSKSGGGMVEISINGNNEVIDLQLDDSLLEDKDSLQILLISAINDCLHQADNNRKMMAMNMMGGLNPFASK
ncbi:MAG: YbaB/EbfC family nucleoid-associated protein [Arcobacteraceae bacterium]|nr:YbaB/EbfC family nucleoid-associated protein [Arcobacteraceae bacterium]MDY0327915.1 YbaB/EbfC family nucleoid-associated protein [Arcobacteraceae bacterium]